MSGWTTHTGQAVALPVDNIDTDQLIPARFMSRQRSQGYGDYLLYDFRRAIKADANARFVLDRHPHASILVTGSNFGGGSSREAAVYALLDAGIRVVISTGFGDIFSANAANNALLTAKVSDTDHARLISTIGDQAVTMAVDIAARTITLEAIMVRFQLEDALCSKLINGWDDIDLTKKHQSRIAAFRDKRKSALAWIWPGTGVEE